MIGYVVQYLSPGWSERTGSEFWLTVTGTPRDGYPTQWRASEQARTRAAATDYTYRVLRVETVETIAPEVKA